MTPEAMTPEAAKPQDALVQESVNAGRPGFRSKLARIIREEGSPLPIRLQWAAWLMSGWPLGAGVRSRAWLYRTAGLAVGPGTLISGPIQFGMSGDPCRNFSVGAGCFVNSPLFVDAAARVTIGDHVSLGHHVVLITSDHAMGPSCFRAGTLRVAPVTIEDGAWIAAGATLLPGVTVGRGAVVAAGAVVTQNVPPDTLVGGIPAKIIRSLSSEPKA